LADPVGLEHDAVEPLVVEDPVGIEPRVPAFDEELPPAFESAAAEAPESREVTEPPAAAPTSDPQVATGELPVSELPAHGLLPDGLPAGELLSDGLLPDGLPAGELPAHGLRPDGLPAGELSADGLSPHELPAHELPPDELPAAELPIEDAAIDLDAIVDPIEIPLPGKLPSPSPPPERLPPLPSATGRRGKRRDPLLERRASRLQAHRSSERKAGGRITRARVGALLVLAVVIALVWFLLALFQPGAGSGHGSVIVAIPKGSSSGQVGTILAREGVVSSGFFFEARALLEGKRGELHSGRFRMRHDMSYAAAIELLSKPAPKVIAVKVVIPEGETRRQIAQLAHADGLVGSYLVASQRSSHLNPTRYGAPAGTPNLEGFLFPATYEMHAGAPASLLVDEQLAAFRLHFATRQIRAARALHVTPYQLLTIASMVEREAQVEHDRPLVAAVIYNRLRLGMTLGIDATIRYALNDYSAPLTEAQLQLNSPYNTRLHTGLPPTPISNPGVASIEAAAHPAHVSYLYYVAAADGCAQQVFSTSYAQFQQNAAAYQRALAKNHGRVPTCKKK
jgi:UPF0755 protein